MYSKVSNFSNFIKLNESVYLDSSRYSIPDIIQTEGGGYEINVVDSKIKDNVEGKITINKKDSQSVNLEFVKGDSTKSETISIPIEDIEISEDEARGITSIKINPYKGWINSEENLIKLEDFIEDFASEVECQKSNYYNSSIKKDVEIILDALDLPLEIDTIEKIRDSVWEIKLNNGSLLELKRRSGNDFIGSLKIYKDEEDHLPSINLDPEKRRIFFFLPDKDNLTIEEPIDFSDLTLDDPYYRYLLKRGLKVRDKKDKEDLLDYFKSKIYQHARQDKESSGDKDKRSWLESESHLKKISKLLSDFMTLEEIEDLYRSESN